MSRSRSLVLVAVVVVGLGLVVAGCLVPQLVLYLLGVLLVAAAVGLLARRWLAARASGVRRVAPVAVVLCVVGLGLGIPYAQARLANADVGWRSDARIETVVGSRAYAWGDDGIRVLDVASGRRLWGVEGEALRPVVADDGSLLVMDERSDGVRRYTPDGHLVWHASTAPAGGERGQLWNVTMTADFVAFTWCRDDFQYLPSRCTLAGIGPDGRRRWTRTFAQAAPAVPRDLLWSRTARATGALALRTPERHGSRLLILDPGTGRALRSVPAPGGSLSAPVITQGTQVVAASAHCGLTSYDASGRQAWHTTYLSDCVEPAGIAAVVAAYPGRLYLAPGTGTVVTVDLSDGRAREVMPGEYDDRLGPEDFGPDVLVREEADDTGDHLVVTDAATGRTRWTRALDMASDDPDDVHFLRGVTVGDAILVEERAGVPNPFLRPGMWSGEGLHLFDDRSRRWVLLDRRTGRVLASAVSADVAGQDLRIELGGDFALIGVDEGSTFRLG